MTHAPLLTGDSASDALIIATYERSYALVDCPSCNGGVDEHRGCATCQGSGVVDVDIEDDDLDWDDDDAA